jgi:K(+)-stimulated pyrophosphate-energized sodium pump
MAMNSGTVAGLSLAGLALLGVGLLYIVTRDPVLLLGLGFGASLICLFARVSRGIYTKAADIGAALDNAKKFEVGNLGGVGNPTHAAAVIGDTIGDPLKDAAGASLDVLMNLIGIVSILFATLFVTYHLFP